MMQDWLTPSEPPIWAPRRRNDEEFRLQKQIVEFLEVALPRDAVFFSIPNEGYRSKTATGKLIATGMLKGVCDLCIVYRGRAIFLEVKSKTGCLSKAQRLVHKRLLAAEAELQICRSVEEVETFLRALGLRLRATCMATPPTNPA